MSRRRTGARPGRWLVLVIVWLVLLGSAAVLAAGVVVPRLGGATPYSVLSGSMRPGLEPGDLVVVRQVPVEETGIGSVITYQLRSGESTTVTHRVVGLTWSPEGERLLTTRGDANAGPDPEPVRPEQVRGEVWYSVPWLGHVSALASPEQRTLVVRLGALGLFAYAGLVVLRGRRRSATATAGGTSAPVESPDDASADPASETAAEILPPPLVGDPGD